MVMTVNLEEVNEAIADLNGEAGLICETYSRNRRVQMRSVGRALIEVAFNGQVVCRTYIVENAVETFNYYGSVPIVRPQ